MLTSLGVSPNYFTVRIAYTKDLQRLAEATHYDEKKDKRKNLDKSRAETAAKKNKLW